MHSRGVGRLVDRHPSVSPERLIAQLHPPPTFAEVSFDSYKPDPAEPSQAAAVQSCLQFCDEAVTRRAGKKKLFGKREVLPGVGLYLDGGFGVGKTHLLASTYYAISATSSAPTAFATFGELTQLAGVFGFVECIELLADYVVVCIDEFELDDPGNTTLISRLLSQLVERGVSIAATSNTLPEQLGEGRFAAQDFLREINTLAAIFTTVRIDGPDYRHRDLPPAPEPLSDRGGRRARRCCAGCDPRRLRRAVRAPGDDAPVAVPDVDRGCFGGVHHGRAPDRRPERGAAAGVADRPALRRRHPGGGFGDEAGHHLQRGDAGRRVPQEVPAGHLAAAGA